MTIRSSVLLAVSVLVSLACHVSVADGADDDRRPPDAAASHRAVADLRAHLALPSGKAGPIPEQPFARVALSAKDAATARDLLWRRHVQRVRKERADEWMARAFTAAGHTLRWEARAFGDAPEGRRSLFISLHGGGNTAKRVNDRQWENQKGLYTPDEGLYVAPRAPTDTWNMWHQDHMDPLLDRLIESFVIFEGVDPNRVYIMGYSAGGDGVYQLAPRMADRWAAAAMMAGHPNEASPLGLRNIGFTIHVGGDDTAYRRNLVAGEWRDKLVELRRDDPDGYRHEVHIHEGLPHWMQRRDAVAVPWMAKFERDPVPERVVWRQDDVLHGRFYWLAVGESERAKGATIVADREGQEIRLESEDVERVEVLLDDRMVDLDRPVAVRAGERELFRGIALRTIVELDRSIAERGDVELAFCARITVELARRSRF